MGLSPGPASTVLRFLRGGCDGCLCGRLCEPCRDAGESGYSEGTVERVTPERVVLTDGRVFRRPPGGAPRPGQTVVIDPRPGIVWHGQGHVPKAAHREETPFVPPRPLDLAPLPLIGAGVVAGIGEGPATVQIGLSGVGAAPIRRDGSLHPDLLSAVASAVTEHLPYPLRPPQPLPDTPYCDVEAVASTISGSDVLTVYSVSYAMPPPSDNPNVPMQRGHVPVYAVGRVNPLTGDWALLATEHLPPPVPASAYRLEPGMEEGEWYGVRGDHVTYPFQRDEWPTTPTARPDAPGTVLFAASFGTHDTYAVIACEPGRVRLASPLRYVRQVPQQGGGSLPEFAHYWRVVTCSADGVSAVTVEAPRTWLPAPPAGDTPPTAILGRFSGVRGGNLLLAAQVQGDGWGAEAVYTLTPTPTLTAWAPTSPEGPWGVTGGRHNVPIEGEEAVLIGPALLLPDGTQSGGRYPLEAPAWLPDPALTPVPWATRDWRTGALLLGEPIPLLRTPFALVASRRVSIGARQVERGGRLRLRAEGASALRRGDRVQLGSVWHPVLGVSAQAFEVVPEVPFTLEPAQVLPVDPDQEITWADDDPRHFPQAMPDPAWYPRLHLLPSGVTLGDWSGALPQTLADPDAPLPVHKRATLRGPLVNSPLTLTFPPSSPVVHAPLLVVTVRLARDGEVRVVTPLPDDLASAAVRRGRWVQLRLRLSTLVSGNATPETVTLVATQPVQISTALLETDP